MNSSTAGRELLLELQRGDRHGTFLPPYNAKLVRECLDDLNAEAQALRYEAEAADSSTVSWEVKPSIVLHHATIHRHKRCLLAYHNYRMKKLQKHILWHSELPSTQNVDEQEFVAAYQELRQQYARSSGVELGMVPPTTSHMVQVRVLVDLGEIVLSSSGRVVRLTKGSLQYLPRTDVKDFLQGGQLELVDGEEVDF
jgi:GINS complex subunit 1